MKTHFKKFNLIFFLLMMSTMIISAHTILASSDVPFEYNILPVEARNTIIDTNAQKYIKFNVFSDTNEAIYYNNLPIQIADDKSFEIEISKLIGKNTISFSNQANETVSFTYYFSDSKGFVPNYELVKDKKLSTYVSTFNNVKIIYSDKEKNAFKKLVSYLKILPKELLENVVAITMIPFENTSNIAGVTKDNEITLYKFSKYSTSTQKNIIYHEIAHTWARNLMNQKVIDHSYSDYSEVVAKDKNYVSNYSKSYIKDKGAYNEDFADSVAFFFINNKSFKKKYPYRFEYINSLAKLREEKVEKKKEN